MRCGATVDHLQLLVLTAMHAVVLQQVHDSLLGRHLGQKKTREKALQRFYWNGIWEDCNNWVLQCNEGARVKDPPNRPRVPLGEMLVGAPLDRLATNIFSESTWGN